MEIPDTFYNDYIEFKKWSNDILKILIFNKSFNDNLNLVKNSSDTNSIKHLEEEKKNELQIENKHLKDENRTLSNSNNLGSEWEVVNFKSDK